MKKKAYEIRRDNQSDVEAIAALFANEDVFPLLGVQPYCSAAQLTVYFSARNREDIGFCCFMGDQLVGYIQVFRANPAPRRAHSYGMMVAVLPGYRKKGIASELLKTALDYADKWIICERIEIVVEVGNIGAIRLYKNFGFVKEGIHKNYVLLDGVFTDVIAMARFKSKK